MPGSFLDTLGLGAAGSGRPTAHDTASRMLAFSKARLLAFAPHGMIVNDVAWEILLALFVAQEQGRRLSLYRLCDEIPMPKSVSVRWLRALRAHGLADYDSEDGLSAQVRLTAAAEIILRDLIEV